MTEKILSIKINGSSIPEVLNHRPEVKVVFHAGLMPALCFRKNISQVSGYFLSALADFM